MRNLLLAPVLASLAIATVRPADACGPYVREPKVFRLSSHYVQTLGQPATRTFALVDAAANTEQLAWTRLAPNTYDYARMSRMSDLATPMAVTLIGPSGTRVITSKQRAVLDHTFETRKPMTALALDLPEGKWSFALEGRHEGAAWIGLEDKTASAADLAWVLARNITPLDPQYVHVGKLAGTQLDTVTVLSKSAGMITFVRSAGDVIAQFEGSVVGAVTIKGQRFVLASSTDGVSPIWI